MTGNMAHSPGYQRLSPELFRHWPTTPGWHSPRAVQLDQQNVQPEQRQAVASHEGPSGSGSTSHEIALDLIPQFRPSHDVECSPGENFCPGHHPGAAA